MSTVSFRKTLVTPKLGSIRMGADFDKALAKAKQLGTQTQSGYRLTQLDINGDGVSDGNLQENLDANGNVTSRSINVALNGVSYGIIDGNADGKVDTFERITSKGGYAVYDNNHDGKADAQSEWTAKGTSHYLTDYNYDGKIDARSDTRRATRKDVFEAAPSVPGFENVQVGASVESFIPADGKQIAWSEGPNSSSKSWDTNGDWLADVTETDTLDANRQVTAKQITLSQPPPATGSMGNYATLSDTDNDGKADQVTVSANNGQWFTAYDYNHDGKVDNEQVNLPDGTSKSLYDSNGDGKVDTVSTWKSL